RCLAGCCPGGSAERHDGADEAGTRAGVPRNVRQQRHLRRLVQRSDSMTCLAGEGGRPPPSPAEVLGAAATSWYRPAVHPFEGAGRDPRSPIKHATHLPIPSCETPISGVSPFLGPLSC